MPAILLSRMSELGLPSDFVRKGLLLLRGGYVRELAAASYPHIHCGGGDFSGIAGGVCAKLEPLQQGAADAPVSAIEVRAEATVKVDQPGGPRGHALLVLGTLQLGCST